jgi:hypothetical protein
VLAQTQHTRVQRLSPKNKEMSPYIPLQAGYRSKKQSSTYIWLHVILLAILFLLCYVTFFIFQFFKLSLSALPSLPTASLSEHSLLFLSYSPLCYKTTCLFLLKLGTTSEWKIKNKWSHLMAFMFDNIFQN